MGHNDRRVRDSGEQEVGFEPRRHGETIRIKRQGIISKSNDRERDMPKLNPRDPANGLLPDRRGINFGRISEATKDHAGARITAGYVHSLLDYLGSGRNRNPRHMRRSSPSQERVSQGRKAGSGSTSRI